MDCMEFKEEYSRHHSWTEFLHGERGESEGEGWSCQNLSQADGDVILDSVQLHIAIIIHSHRSCSLIYSWISILLYNPTCTESVTNCPKVKVSVHLTTLSIEFPYAGKRDSEGEGRRCKQIKAVFAVQGNFHLLTCFPMTISTTI